MCLRAGLWCQIILYLKSFFFGDYTLSQIIESYNGWCTSDGTVLFCIPHVLIVIAGDGTGSTSIYGDYFEDEALTVEHNRPGYLGMANRGTDTNGCQFYITTISASWLDGKHTVFGKVLDGMDTVHAIEDVSSI